MNVFKIVINLFSVIAELVIIKYLYTYLLKGSRLSQWQERVLYLGGAAFMMAATSISINQFVMIFASLSVALLLAFTYYGKWSMKVFLSVTVIILLGLSELIIGALLVLFTGLQMDHIQDNMVLYMFGTLFSKLLIFLLVKTVGFRKLDIYKSMPLPMFLGLLLTPLSSFVAMYILAISLDRQDNPSTMAAVLGASVLMLVAAFFVFYLYEKQMQAEHAKARLAFLEKQMASQAEHYRELSERQLDIRALSHDMKNSLIGLLGLLQENNTAEAIEYLERCQGLMNNAAPQYDTGHPPIDAMLVSKQQAMQAQNIAFEAQIAMPAEIIIDIVDLCIVLGCALDNALEACEKIEDEQRRRIVLNISTTEKYLSIRVENSTKEPTSSSLPQTSKADKYYHGFGLESIRSIAQKYDGSTTIEHKNYTFQLTILVKSG